MRKRTLEDAIKAIFSGKFGNRGSDGGCFQYENTRKSRNKIPGISLEL